MLHGYVVTDDGGCMHLSKLLIDNTSLQPRRYASSKRRKYCYGIIVGFTVHLFIGHR
ncbi:hypothetical protein L798_07027 [Zootermopsis nevadensis]|uniref:Uncharacterized protein n=1 Tax=Zootermopsis nevadensis TaxID=136037 RepID=A0A067R5V8_ZOONE|nr:hypothetical protein L798_07027 [Zootermopsis nevadensis]